MGTLFVLGTTADDRLSRLRAGEATSAVLLAATRMGLASCPLTQPLETPATWELVRTSVLDGLMVPHMVLRVGWPQDGPSPFPVTARRPVSDVTAWVVPRRPANTVRSSWSARDLGPCRGLGRRASVRVWRSR